MTLGSMRAGARVRCQRLYRPLPLIHDRPTLRETRPQCVFPRVISGWVEPDMVLTLEPSGFGFRPAFRCSGPRFWILRVNQPRSFSVA
ncbi:hypothetical protein PanWU01x14_139450 [Parasponia andersonii]|uniref:Uncharacterized protein n=1 Tax=Parasponia andersonii TaxID=3476 RepID=A0A2P5CML5_PARAD|nr:hypothetical protein PanWU01x14_139450 [Parasponia andersonii]